MANLNKETIKNLTLLCRIDCSEKEQEELLQNLQSIFDYFEQLNEVDTAHVKPCNHVLEDIVNVMREDQVGETMPRDIFLANAPSQAGGLIKVPLVLKQKH